MKKEALGVKHLFGAGNFIQSFFCQGNGGSQRLSCLLKVTR